jgi:hypothetical protein
LSKASTVCGGNAIQAFHCSKMICIIRRFLLQLQCLYYSVQKILFLFTALVSWL